MKRIIGVCACPAVPTAWPLRNLGGRVNWAFR